jgi:hypothetical protein
MQVLHADLAIFGSGMAVALFCKFLYSGLNFFEAVLSRLG